MGDKGEEEPSVLCYNKGCGQTFKESENTFNSCRFHPGEPFFHDAYKGWSCCRKSTDFTEFLNMKGCATGYHSNVKPPEPEKKKPEVSTEDEIIEVVSRPDYVPMERPSADAPMVQLSNTMSESLKKQTYGEENKQDSNNDEVELKIGVTKCQNKGCGGTYQGPETDSEQCKYHPGVPIFHEGLKYWSCCQKKTTEFDVFMQQVGCQTGSHVWVKPKEEGNGDGSGGGTKTMKCRHDWHQDGSYVHIVVYGGGKKFDPEKSHVKANGVKVDIELYFPEEGGKYQENWLLTGIIDPEKSSTFMTPMKVEIKLKKAEPVKWPKLNISKEALKKAAEVEKEAEAHKDVGVDPVDLSDL